MATKLSPSISLTFGLSFFCGAMGVYMAPFQIGAMVDSGYLSISESGFLSAVEISAMSLTAILIAPKLDHFERGNIACLGAFIAAVAQISSGSLSDFDLHLLSRGLVGLGCGLIFGAAAAATVATDNPDRSFGIGQAIMNLLFLLLYLGSPYVIETFQYQGLVVLFGCLFLTFCPVFRALPDANTKIQIVDESKQSLDPIAVGVLVIATVCLNLGLGALWGYVELIGTSQVALTTRQVASVLSLTTIAMIAGSLMASWLSSTYGRGRPMCVASICCAISVLAVANATSITVYFGGLMLYNFAYLFISPYIFAGVSSTIDASGRLASVMIGTVFLSYSAGIALGGLIIETLGISAMGWFGFVGCLISAPMYYQLCLRLDS